MDREKSFDDCRTSSAAGKRRSLSAGGVIARGPRRSGGGVFSLSIVFHISTRFFALPIYIEKTKHFIVCLEAMESERGREREKDKRIIV